MSWIRPIVLAAAVVFAVPAAASAQWIEFMEWLDKLSGPGPFEQDPGWLPSVRIPVGCIKRVTYFAKMTTPDVRELLRTNRAAATQGKQTRITEGQRTALNARINTAGEVEPDIVPAWLPACLGLGPEIREFNDYRADKQGNDDRRSPPWGEIDVNATRRPIIHTRNLLGFEVKLSHLESERNELAYGAEVSESQKQVDLFVYGAGVRFFHSEDLFTYAGVEAYRFYSDAELFEPFQKVTGIVELGAKPLAFTNVAFLKQVTMAFGATTGLGRFNAADFGATGPWQAYDGWNPYLQFGYDFWAHSCWPGVCPPRR